MSEASRLAALEQAGLVHPRAEAVTAALFSSGGFFLPADKVQVKYEMLRANLLQAGVLPGGLAAARFTRRGLAGLIAWPAAEPDFRADLLGAARPPWTPHADPREQALAATYQFLLDTADVLAAAGSAMTEGWS